MTAEFTTVPVLNKECYASTAIPGAIKLYFYHKLISLCWPDAQCPSWVFVALTRKVSQLMSREDGVHLLLDTTETTVSLSER